MNKLLLWLVIILPFFCITCQKEVVESQRYPRVGTLDVVDVTSEGATFRGDILSLVHIPEHPHPLLDKILSVLN